MGVRPIEHWRNLSRGLLCPCPTTSFGVVRIQSTHCEQKLWSRIIHDLGADFLYSLAKGSVIIVHDWSERPRETRACWQGLSWIRYACHRAWYDTLPHREISRGGIVISPYWEKQYQRLPRSTRYMLRYYRQYVNPDLSKIVFLTSCYKRRQSNERMLVA